MPRVSRQQSALNRAAITAVSARLFREHGIQGVSVADLMDAAGLTHGGFYGHFESKDALAAAACSSAFADSAQRWRRRIADSDGRNAARTAIVDGFLSIKSRNAPGLSCPTATLAGDVAREPAGAPIRTEFTAGLEELLQILGTLQTGSAAEQRQHAAADLAAMVGAQVLARATSDSAMSEQILAAVRARLLGRKAGA